MNMNVNQLELCINLLLIALFSVMCDFYIEIDKLEKKIKSQQKTIDILKKLNECVLPN